MIFKYFLTAGRYIVGTYGTPTLFVYFSSVFSLRKKKILDTEVPIKISYLNYLYFIEKYPYDPQKFGFLK